MLDVYIDMDGVTVDFYSMAAKILGVPYRSIEPMQTWSVLEKIDHFFLTLPKMHDADVLWAGVKANSKSLSVLTASPRPTGKLVTAAADKREYIRKHFDPRTPVIVMKDGTRKAEFARPTAILIDDLKRNVDLWELHGGIGILHTSAVDTLEKLKKIQALHR
ncbi:hypothetical protein [Comamonas thiooxydans]|uniref:hypothetical protein n=1 Tax=Comamonas thiooxydans TaxID=363952 RepID=UPI0011856710|nr:hypothetical protein [Comamonas thiooxydans]